MTEYGSDLAGVEDVDAQLTYLDSDDPRVVSEAMAIRYDTPRGGLFYDPSYGMTVTQFLADVTPPALAERLLSQEGLKDERVAACEVKIKVNDDGSWKTQINPQGAEGPFDHTFLPDESKLSLLTDPQTQTQAV